MADYVRVNWQNDESGNTPINAYNLNIMDKGIKDLDDKAGEIDAKVDAIAVSVSDDGNGNVTLSIGGTTT